ncbi:MAG: c-type cytochrome [Burkholderiaceae bacterium]|nr:c-type cytochrome [Burkholderiaceae bacterium]
MPRLPLPTPALLLGLSLTLATLALPARASDVATLRLAALAATCANCHGTDGRAVDASVVPGLAGQSSAFIVEQMRAFKSGARPATVMHQIARGYSDAQIEAIAGYFASRPATAR